jgi:hypothetical protein
MKKIIIWIVAIVLIIVAIFLIYRCSSKNDTKDLEAEQLKAKYVAALVSERNRVDSLKNELDYLQLELDTCEQGLVPELTPEQEIANLKAEVEALKSKPAPVSRARTTTRTSSRKTTQPDVSETVFTSTFTTPARSSSEIIVSSGSSTPNATYEPKFEGDAGTTINGNKRNPVYYHKNVGLEGSTFYVNGDINKKMLFDKTKNLWFFIDYSEVISEEDMNKVRTWNIKGGDKNWGGGSYPIWYPHEYLKPLINSSRGFEYGRVTNDDLNKMSQSDARVWSPNNPNGIFQPLVGINKDRNDPSYWDGWNLRGRINYRKISN